MNYDVCERFANKAFLWSQYFVIYIKFWERPQDTLLIYFPEIFVKVLFLVSFFYSFIQIPSRFTYIIFFATWF